MVGKRSVYINFLSVLFLLISVVFLNATVFHRVFPDYVYRLLNIYNPKNLDVLGSIEASESLERENAMLRKQLGVAPKSDRRLMLAKIISIERNAVSSSLFIDKGSRDGIEVDRAVIGAGNILIGKVHEVFENTSRVVLTDDPRVVISVRMQGSSLLAEARGSRKNTLDIGLVAHHESVQSGNIFVTSGLDAFPEGLVVARVRDATPGSNSLFQEITSEVLYNFHESPLLFVIL